MSKPQVVNPLAFYRPLRWAHGFHGSKKKFRGTKGGVRSGKTWAKCVEVIRHATRTPGGRWLIGRQNFTDMRETVMDDFRTIVGMTPGLQRGRYHETHHTMELVTHTGQTCQILFKSLEDAQSLGSLKLSGFYVCEAGEVKESVFDMLASRLNLGDGPHYGILDWNPTGRGHWLFEKFQAHPGPDFELFTAPTYDNRANLPEDYIESLERSWSEEKIKRYLAGEWGFTGEGQAVFPVFAMSRHVGRFSVLADQPLVLGWDFGFRRPACVIGQIQDGSLIVFDALLGRDQSLDSFADEVMATVARLTGSEKLDHQHYGDVAGKAHNQVTAESCFSRLAARGIHIRASVQGIHAGLELLRARLEKLSGPNFGLMFDRDCSPLLIEAMDGGYHYATDKRAMGSDFDPVPEKDGVYDHLVDALRYLAVGLFGITGKRSGSNAHLESIAYKESQRLSLRPHGGQETALGALARLRRA